MSAYRINGIDPELQYGLIVEKGVDAEILAMPALKDSGLDIDFVEENGTDRYHGSRKFESKRYQVQCCIKAESATALMVKYNALEQFLLNTAVFNFDDVIKNRRWKVFYKRMEIIDKGISWIRFRLELIDDYPTDLFTIS